MTNATLKSLTPFQKIKTTLEMKIKDPNGIYMITQNCTCISLTPTLASPQC